MLFALPLYSEAVPELADEKKMATWADILREDVWADNSKTTS